MRLIAINNFNRLTFICFFSFSDDESMQDNTSVVVLNAAKEKLLQGLSDENQGLQ